MLSRLRARLHEGPKKASQADSSSAMPVRVEEDVAQKAKSSVRANVGDQMSHRADSSRTMPAAAPVEEDGGKEPKSPVKPPIEVPTKVDANPLGSMVSNKCRKDDHGHVHKEDDTHKELTLPAAADASVSPVAKKVDRDLNELNIPDPFEISLLSTFEPSYSLAEAKVVECQMILDVNSPQADSLSRDTAVVQKSVGVGLASDSAKPTCPVRTATMLFEQEDDEEAAKARIRDEDEFRKASKPHNKIRDISFLMPCGKCPGLCEACGCTHPAGHSYVEQVKHTGDDDNSVKAPASASDGQVYGLR